MKRLLFFILLITSGSVSGQNKLSWELITEISGIMNSSPKNKPFQIPSSPGGGTGVGYLLDTAGMPVYLSSNAYIAYMERANTIQYKSKLTAGATIGGRLNYPLSKNLDLTIGATVSFMHLTRTTNYDPLNSFLTPGYTPNDSLFGVSGTGSIVFVGTANVFFSSLNKQVETFSFTTFNIPIGIRYKKAKWSFETGIRPAFIINSSKRKTAQPYNGEIHINESPFKNTQTTTIGLSIGPNYQITKSISAGIQYVHGLSTLITSENTRRLLSRTINLKLLYKL
jgi:hypothetical protein